MSMQTTLQTTMEELKRQILELAKPSATDIDNPTLERLIVRACNPALTGSNLALNIEICELINRKKGNWPHDAAFLVAKYSNSLNASQALLALELLDVCVKNCGHAFHLQIGSKDFLNELVRRFPEFPSQQHAQPKLRERIPVNNRILQFIQEWRTTLCVNSRFKDDLRKIEDMARMLEFKGYKLPTLEGKSEVLLGPRDSLRTVEEIEREDSDALKAKLQELLRRATPTDLAEANRIMQILAGYDEEGDARREQLQSQWEEEIASVESRANLLIDLLKDMNPGDVLDEFGKDMYDKCVAQRKRILKIIGETGGGDEDDDERTKSTARLLNLNDLLCMAIQAADDINAGRQPTFSDVSPSVTTESNHISNATSEMEPSLIDFDDAQQSSSSGDQSVQTTTDLLAGLDFTPSASQSPAQPKKMNTSALIDLLDMSSTTSTTSTATNATTATKQQQQQPQVYSRTLAPPPSTSSNSNKPYDPFAQLFD